MQCLMTFEEAADAIKAETVGGIPAGGRAGGFCGVCIDSREAKPGFLFAALEGEKTDGHLFAGDAFRNGAVCTLAGKDKVRELGLDALAKKHNARLLVTEDSTLAAFQGLAKAYLAKFPDLLRVGITGSSGKTTTKEIFASIAAQEKNIVYNRGNFNSETGLPVSVFNVRGEHEIGVFEAAMNHPGEIAALRSVGLSEKAKHRTEVSGRYFRKSARHSANGKKNAAMTCRHFGTRRSQFYRQWTVTTRRGPSRPGRVQRHLNVKESMITSAPRLRRCAGYGRRTRHIRGRR